jgi:Tfp pilus assembly protein PilF
VEQKPVSVKCFLGGVMKYTKYLLGGLLIIFLIFSVSCQNRYLTAAKIALQLSPPDYDEALANLKLCVQEDPKNAQAHNLMGQIYAEKNMYQEMLDSFKKAESLDPSLKEENDNWRENKWANVFNKGLQEVRAENLTSAREQFQTAIFIDSTRWESYANLGFTYSRMDSVDGAYRSYKKAFQLKGDDINTALDFATVCYQAQRWDEAEKAYRQLLELDPEHSEALIRLPEIYKNQGRLEDSKVAYEKTLKILPDNQDVWFNLGVLCFHDLKDYDCAAESFKKVAELVPEDQDANMNLALSYLMQDKYDLAAPILEKLVQMDEKNCDAWEMLSGTYTQLKKPDKAREAFLRYRSCME